jgi:hypothetical protein
MWSEHLPTKISFFSGSAGVAFLTLAGGLIARLWFCLPETSQLKRKVASYFRKAIQFLGRHWLPGLLLSGTLATAIAVHVLGLHWKDAVEVLLQISLTSSIIHGLSLIATVWGGLMLTSIEPGRSKRMLAGILFGLGMLIAGVNLPITSNKTRHNRKATPGEGGFVLFCQLAQLIIQGEQQAVPALSVLGHPPKNSVGVELLRPQPVILQ